MKPLFNSFEIVIVENPKPELDYLKGMKGAILGMGKDHRDDTWYYVVHLYKLEECGCLHERELQSTGQYDQRENFYGDSSIKVIVDDETGEGKLGGVNLSSP